MRSGCEKATVQMVAEYENKEIIITRELSGNGKNICKIDDRIVTLGELSQVCSKIADIHGQYETQSLLKTENHIKLVDAYEKGSIEPSKIKVAEYYENFLDIRRSRTSTCRRCHERVQAVGRPQWAREPGSPQRR